MPFGPIFHWEFAAIARRERNYVIRFLYGLVILTCFSFPLLGTSGLSSARELEHRKLAAASMESFSAVVWGESLALFLVTPALFAGAIAQEIERGNLTLLLTSPITSLEIVLGKMGPRFAQVVLIVAVAMPVLSLLSLNGGIDEKLVLLSNSVLLVSTFLIASSAILISVLSASVRQAVLATYVAEILWLMAPSLCDLVTTTGPPAVRAWSSSIGGVLAVASPVPMLWALTGQPATMVGDFMTTILVELGLGSLFVAVAAALLRPVAKGAGPLGWRFAPVSFLLSRRRLLPRRACGVRPVLWKEMHVSRSRVLTRVFLAVAALAVLIPLGYYATETAAAAFEELAAAGYGTANPTRAREHFNIFLRGTLTMAYMMSGIGLAVFTGTSMTHEKEKNTWTSLIATPLGAREIIEQKMIGALWRLRWLLLLYFLFLVLGIAAGAIHPLGGILNIVQMTAFLGFAAGLGTWLSICCKSSVRSLGWTFFTLFMLNGGYLLGCVLLRDMMHPAVFCLVTPLLLGFSITTYSEVDWFLKSNGTEVVGSTDVAWLIVLNVLFYGVSAIVLCFCCSQAFESAAGRPRRL